jgi:hypothetical protein
MKSFYIDKGPDAVTRYYVDAEEVPRKEFEERRVKECAHPHGLGKCNDCGLPRSA